MGRPAGRSLPIAGPTVFDGLMRAIWSGSLTFSLVNVPVKMFSATSSHDVAFHQVHAADGGRIRYERRCEVCGRKVDFENIDKAYDDGEQTVVLTEEDLEELPADADADEIDVVRFVPADQIDPIMYQKPYVLQPVGKSPKAYALLRRTLEETDRIAVVRFTLRQKTRLGALRVRGDALILQGLLWADEVREISVPEAAKSAKGGKVGKDELRMASALVEQFSGDFEPEQYEDDYQDELRELIDAKLEHGDAMDTEATFGREAEDDEGSGSGGSGSGGGKVLDLMGALEASLGKRGAARSGGGSAEKGEASGGGRTTGGKAASSGGKRTGGAKKTSGGASSGGKKASGGTKGAGGTKAGGGKKASSGQKASSVKASGGTTSSGGKTSRGKKSSQQAKSA